MRDTTWDDLTPAELGKLGRTNAISSPKASVPPNANVREILWRKVRFLESSNKTSQEDQADPESGVPGSSGNPVPSLEEASGGSGEGDPQAGGDFVPMDQGIRDAETRNRSKVGPIGPHHVSFGEFLASILQLRGLTQMRAAELSGMNHSTLSRYATGKRLATVEAVQKICLGLALDGLLCRRLHTVAGHEYYFIEEPSLDGITDLGFLVDDTVKSLPYPLSVYFDRAVRGLCTGFSRTRDLDNMTP